MMTDAPDHSESQSVVKDMKGLLEAAWDVQPVAEKREREARIGAGAHHLCASDVDRKREYADWKAGATLYYSDTLRKHAVTAIITGGQTLTHYGSNGGYFSTRPSALSTTYTLSSWSMAMPPGRLKPLASVPYWPNPPRY